MLTLSLLAGPALGAPTCQDREGETVRCGTPRAMPVGWSAPAGQAEQYLLAHPGPPAKYVLHVALGIALLFILIALLPDFDGRRDEGWQ